MTREEEAAFAWFKELPNKIIEYRKNTNGLHPPNMTRLLFALDELNTKHRVFPPDNKLFYSFRFSDFNHVVLFVENGDKRATGLVKDAYHWYIKQRIKGTL